MKKVLLIVAIFLIVIISAYILLMAKFEEPLCIDLTNHAQLSVEEQTLKLPWYMNVGITYDCKFNGTDVAGQKYTKFIYALPEVFESSELNCIVCWETKQVIAFIGDTRAMSVMDEVFPELQWN